MSTVTRGATHTTTRRDRAPAAMQGASSREIRPVQPLTGSAEVADRSAFHRITPPTRPSWHQRIGPSTDAPSVRTKAGKPPLEQQPREGIRHPPVLARSRSRRRRHSSRSGIGVKRTALTVRWWPPATGCAVIPPASHARAQFFLASAGCSPGSGLAQNAGRRAPSGNPELAGPRLPGTRPLGCAR